MATEIERKFWIEHLPESVDLGQPSAIMQGYLSVEKGGNETRIRSIDGAFILTVKGSGTLVRGEWEIAITAPQFEHLWPATQGRRIVKDRFSFDWEGNEIELDVYHDGLEGLIIAEVEFASEAAAAAFAPAPWMGKELTEMETFRNKALAQGAIWEDLRPLLHS